MTELSFAKAFLTTLDSRPIKLQADYAVDPKELQLQGPFTLPRMPRPMTRSTATPPPGSAPALRVTLKSLRNPPFDISLPAQPFTTSVLDLKQAVAAHLNAAGTDKIKLLYKKKPCADTKTLKEVLGDETPREIEFGVMVMGGLPPEEKKDGGAGSVDVVMTDAPVAQGGSGLAVMGSGEFWEDLGVFLEQRTGSQEVAQRAVKIFEEAWKLKA